MKSPMKGKRGGKRLVQGSIRGARAFFPASKDRAADRPSVCKIRSTGLAKNSRTAVMQLEAKHRPLQATQLPQALQFMSSAQTGLRSVSQSSIRFFAAEPANLQPT
jgi:hypothetical protein